jgi:glutamate/tyrosine decarboxylase-like PLP-dependent enzyme
MKFERQSLEILQAALERLEDGFTSLPDAGTPAGELAAMQHVLLNAATRMQDNFPYFHPLYCGQMLKPPHPVARAAYALATWTNPNNHALDGGRASSAMEVEAVAELARMVGFATHLGHLTSGGTIANLEALWVSGQLAREAGKPPLILCSEQAHYTHTRISAVLGLQCETVACDSRGRMDDAALETRLLKAAGQHVTVVVTFGTTAVGAVDPLDEVLRLQARYGFRVHVDAAYGGYFVLAGNLADTAQAAANAIAQADSLVIDPHKHGLQPYGCGCVLFRDPAVGRFYKHDSPYTYFSSSQLHLGEITLECSRAGAAAVALWSTQQLLPLERGGGFAAMLSDCHAAALGLHTRLLHEPQFATMSAPELDIVCWAVRAETLETASHRAQQIFDAAAKLELHLALVKLPARFFPELAHPSQEAALTCLRSVLMKPEHKQWLPEIWKRLMQAAASEA